MWLWLNVFSTNPSYSIVPWSWTNLKLYCRYNFDILLNSSWAYYNAFDATLKFNSWEVDIAHKLIDPFFSVVSSGIVRSWFIYRTQWAAVGWVSNNENRNVASFVFYSIANIWSTILNFTNCNWWPTFFESGTTDDCSTVNSSINNLDILAWSNDASYTFSALPCIIDTDSPKISDISVSDWSQQIPSNQIISMLINDREWNPTANVDWPPPLESNKRSHYRYWWLITNIWNYVDAPDTVDNQEWVNSWSIKITITAPNYPAYWTYILSSANLTLSDFTWNSNINKFTRDSEIRWYNVSFSPPNPYPIEKQINVSISARDRPNETWQSHTWTYSFSFNAPISPTITMLYPTNTTFLNPSLNEIRFYITDNWAWVDTWSIQFTIPAIYSWATLLMNSQIYSWNDLTFILSWWSPWLWNWWDYIVYFVPKSAFPTNSNVIITWKFADLAWNTGIANFSFSIRPDCTYFGCPTFLGIDMGWIISVFSWDFLIITWTNPDWPYPYLTWINNDILMCWPNFTWTSITGNIQLENTNRQSILWLFYTWTRLYITWLDLILSWNIIFIQ